jgi:hypothetical protein
MAKAQKGLAKPPGGKKGGVASEAQRRRQVAILKLGGIAAAVVVVLSFLTQARFGYTSGVATIGLNETETVRCVRRQPLASTPCDYIEREG